MASNVLPFVSRQGKQASELMGVVIELARAIEAGHVRCLAVTWQTEDAMTWGLRWTEETQHGDMYGLLAGLELVKKEILDGLSPD